MAGDFDVIPHSDVSNPVLSAEDVTDVADARYVADPFYVFEDGIHNLFFEIFTGNEKGVIGHATSDNGRTWTYQQRVLEEPFHLAFPYVFQYESDWYMIPDYFYHKTGLFTVKKQFYSTDLDHSVRLYRSIDFPAEWELATTFLPQKRVTDSVVFQWKGLWYLLVRGEETGVALYYSEDIESNVWNPHPESPITTTNTMGRMAGRPIIDQDLYLPFQDGRYLYGEKVRCCRVDVLNENQYEHNEISTSPIVQAQFDGGWNDQGMHHIDASPFTEYGQDFVIVDGCNRDENWSIGMYEMTGDIRQSRDFSRSQKTRRYYSIVKRNAYGAQKILRQRMTQ